MNPIFLGQNTMLIRIYLNLVKVYDKIISLLILKISIVYMMAF